MTIFKKTWSFCAKAGLSLFILFVMFTGAISLFSISQKGKIYYGNRCKTQLNESAIKYLNQKEIIAYDYELNCNTLYLDLTLDESISEESAKTLLIRISSYYESINYNTDTQIILKGNNYLIFASLVDKEITMSISNL